MNKFIILIFVLILSSSLLFAQKNYGISLSTGAYIPVGNINDNYNPSYGFEGGFIFSANRALQLSVNTGYLTFSFDNDGFNNNNGEQGHYDLEAPLSAIPLTFGLKYLIGDLRNYKPYFGLDAGLYFYNQKISGNYTDKNGVVTRLDDQKINDNDTVLKFAIGLLYKVNRNLYIDVSTKYNIFSNNKTITTNPDGSVDTDSKTANFLSISGGIQYFL